MVADLALAVAIGVLLAGAGFFAVAETSLTRLTPVKAAALVSSGRRGARSLSELVRHPDRYLNTLLLLALGCQLVAATLVGVLASRHLGATGVAIVTTAEVIVVFVVAEAAPKSWALLHLERAALVAAPVARGLVRITPLRLLSSALVRAAGALLGSGRPSRPLVTEAELLAAAELAAESEVIEPEEQAAIHAVIAFGDRSAGQVMVAEDEMVTVDVGATFDEALDVIVASSLSRLPVVDSARSEVVGLLYAKDVLHALGALDPAVGERPDGIRALLRSARHVSAEMPLAELLRQMRDGRFHMVIVTDGASTRPLGLVTIEDLIEELVGEISDEYDRSP